MDNAENTKSILHILDVRDWMISLYEEKFSPLLHKLSSSIIPELCPHYGKFYKSMLDDCEKKMYDLRTCVVNVQVAGFNHYGKNLLCNHLLRRDILLPLDKDVGRSRERCIPISLCFQSGPLAQHNNAKFQFKNESSFLHHIRNAEELSTTWDEATAAYWIRYKARIQDIYDRRLEGVTYKVLSNDELSLLSRQPYMIKTNLFSNITIITHILGIARYGITLSDSLLHNSISTSESESLIFEKSQIIVAVIDEPKTQLNGQALNALMQQKINGKDVIFVLHKKYDSDAHTNTQYTTMLNALNKCNMFGNEKIHLLDFNSLGEDGRNYIAFERQLASKISENIRACLISCVEKFFQLVSCAEQLLTRFVSSYSNPSAIPEKLDFVKNVAQEEIFEDKLSQVEKTITKEIHKLKKSSRQFFKEFIKDMIPYMQIHAATYKPKSTNVGEIRKDILLSLNSIFRTSFESLYLEWVLVKRSSFAQCLLDTVTPLLDHMQLEVGRNYPPTPAFLLQYAKNLVNSGEQHSEDFKVTVANSGIVVSDSLIQIQIEDTSEEIKETNVRQSSYMEFVVHLMRIQSDKQVSLSLSTGAFGMCTILKEYMIKNIRNGFGTMRSLARVMYPSHHQVDYSMLCKVLYLRDDIVRHLKQLNSMLMSVAEFPTLLRMRKVVATYSFSDPGMCAICLKKYTRCSHLCASCCVELKGQPCPFCNKWSHYSSELNATVSNMNSFIASLARNEVSPHTTTNWGNSKNRSQIFTAINKNGRVISEFQNWFMEILNRNDFSSSKATEVFTCFVNAIIAKHTPPECRNLPDNYQKIMMKCVSELFTEDFFPAVLDVFKKEYREQDEALHAKTALFKHCKASTFMKDCEEANVLDEIDLYKAVVEFNKISTHTRPYEKCERVFKASEIITNAFTQLRMLMGADFFLPCIVFVLVQSDLPNPTAEFHFLCSFMETHCAHFEQYILQTFYSIIVSAPSLLEQMLLEGEGAQQ